MTFLIKRYNFLVLAAMLVILSQALPVSAEPQVSDLTPGFKGQLNDRHGKIVPLEPDGAGGDITMMVTTHIAWITVAGDEEWRAHFGSSWTTAANNAIETADNAMYSNFGIDLRSHHYSNWSSSSAGITNLLNELQNNIPLNGGDFRQGYTNQSVASGKGAAYILGFSSLVKHQDAVRDWQATQHEISHIYGAYDRYRDPTEANLTHVTNPSIRCVMADPYHDAGIWCWDQPWFDFNYLANYNTRFD